MTQLFGICEWSGDVVGDAEHSTPKTEKDQASFAERFSMLRIP
jgi:hypothetical protein